MTSGAVPALAADRDALLEICAGLTDAAWKAESGCPGWSVHDVVGHLGALFWVVVDPSTLPDVDGLPTEKAQDVYVEARRSWSTAMLVRDYERASTLALEVLPTLESQDFELTVGDLGTYRAETLPNAYAFDHFTHIRADLFGPRGPLAGSPPPADALRLVPTLDWIEAALPQQNADAIARLGGGVEISVHGLAARNIVAGSGPAVAHITSDATALVRWITQRGSWEELAVSTTGDADALAIARTFHIF
jgi:uncharacterized protein (TIGR03083 family)